MSDFLQARKTMVDCQICTNGVTDARVIDAFMTVPREAFVPKSRLELAYIDADLPLGEGEQRRYLIQPMILAKLIQGLKIHPQDRILDVGSATGYSAAILAQLGAHVTAFESDSSLAEQARTNLAAWKNIDVCTGEFASALQKAGPFDVILLQGAVDEVPEAFFMSLKEGGRLIRVVGRGRSGQAILSVRIGMDFAGHPVFDAALPQLPGFSRKPAFVF